MIPFSEMRKYNMLDFSDVSEFINSIELISVEESGLIENFSFNKKDQTLFIQFKKETCNVFLYRKDEDLSFINFNYNSDGFSFVIPLSWDMIFVTEQLEKSHYYYLNHIGNEAQQKANREIQDNYEDFTVEPEIKYHVILILIKKIWRTYQEGLELYKECVKPLKEEI